MSNANVLNWLRAHKIRQRHDCAESNRFVVIIEEISGMFPAQYKANADEPVPVPA